MSSRSQTLSWPRKCASPECDTLVYRRFDYGAPPRYCNKRCLRRTYRIRCAVKIRSTNRHYRRSVRGRECRWCLRTDSETGWTRTLHECSACQRLRNRGSVCELCGGPFRKMKTKIAPEGGCIRCSQLTEYERMELREKKRRASS